MSDFRLEEFLPYQLAILSMKVSEGFARIYKEKFGISVAEWRVLAHLSQDEKVSIREIHCRVRMDKSKTSRAAARLEKAGYVTKRENRCDRRLVELALTESGRALVDEIAPLGMEYQARVLEALPEPERTEFRQAVVALLEQFE
ncbi:MAG: MarR family transcriptional regulator [Paracoccaceae bacterium]|nr:MarR family transcriptional regulator [Paracoccaceae bacterium]